MIDSQTKQRIIDSANILEVVSDFISLRRSGASYVGLCPFHSDRKPSFYVSPSKNVCKCFSCGEGGSPLHFIMKHEQLSYNEALRYLAKKYHIEIIEREETDEEKQAASERQSLFVLNEYAAAFFRQSLHETEEGRNIGLSYFRERGLRPETIEKFGLGYSPEERDALTRQATSAGYPLERLTATGLSIQYDDKPAIDRFRGRIIFPVRNLSGQYVAFGGRVMSKTDKTAKYVNSPESAIYSKSRELYGLYWAKQAISKADKCYLVEGYTDVISMHQSGIENVVSSSGTALTQQQIRLIRRFTEHVTVLYDGDSAGIKAALRGIDLLLEEGLSIKVVLLPEGEDPDSYAQKHSASEFLAYLNEAETDFIHFKIRLYQEEMQRDPIKRAELIKDILHSIALIPDTIRRTVLVQSSAGLLKVDEQLLSAEVQKLRMQGVRAAGSYISQGGGGVSVPQQAIPTAVTRPSIPTSEPELRGEEAAVPGAKAYEPYRHELALLRLIMQRGSEPILPLIETDAGWVYQSYQIADFVGQEVELDNILDDLSPVCREILQETREHCLPQSLDCAVHFMSHESEGIRRLSADLLAGELKYARGQEQEKEADYKLEALETKLQAAQSEAEREEALRQIAEYEEERIQQRQKQLAQEVQWELDQIRMAIILKSIAQIQDEMIEAEKAGDTERLLALIVQLQEENNFKQELAQALGERTIKAY